MADKSEGVGRGRVAGGSSAGRGWVGGSSTGVPHRVYQMGTTGGIRWHSQIPSELGRRDEQMRGTYEPGRRHEQMRGTYELGERDGESGASLGRVWGEFGGRKT